MDRALRHDHPRHGGNPLLELDVPLIAAPMAGGPSTPALVVAAARAGGLGFLAGGYRTPDDLAAQITAVRAAGVSFGVNLFAPPIVPVDPPAYDRYRAELERAYAISLPAVPREDDDHWRAKLDLLLTDPVPVVSFTFGVPEPRVLAALRRAGTITVQTVTSADEARAATGVDALIMQSPRAGGHFGTFATPDPLPDALPLPLFAAGGVGTAADVDAALASGAEAVVIGTMLLLADEAGTSAPYRAALAAGGETVVTRAFSGRPARGLRNAFIDEHDAGAPAGYPAVHHLTSPIRRAATARGDAGLINVWAGTGHRHARAEPLAATFTRLSARNP